MATEVRTPDTTVDLRGAHAPIAVGATVEVRNRFDDRWIHGFAIAIVGDAAYQLRRLSDGYVLPAWFSADVIRPDRSS